MAERECLFCGVSEAEVRAVRRRDGYTLGCGIESNTENGFDYDELSEHHRWADWKDAELTRMGIKPAAFDRYRRANDSDIRWADCEDRLRGHTPSLKTVARDDYGYGIEKGQCIECGKKNADATPGENREEQNR